MMIVITIFFILISAGLFIGLAGTIVCVALDVMTNIDAYDAAEMFLTIALISFALYALLIIVVLIISGGKKQRETKVVKAERRRKRAAA